MRSILESSFLHALKTTSPKRLVQKHLPKEKPSLILSVGKAAMPMLEGALEVFPDVPYLVTPPLDLAGELQGGKSTSTIFANDTVGFSTLKGSKGARDFLPPTSYLLPSTHPIPSQHSVIAAEKALELASQLSEKDLLLVLVSGGGSALWCAPWGISLEEKQTLTQALLRSGADIQELNTVRKHLSRIKGGRLAKVTQARVHALLLSDVIGDDMSVIASGLTVGDKSTFAEALEILDRYKLAFPGVREHFQKGQRGDLPESPKLENGIFARVENQIIGSNFLLLKAAQHYLSQQGFNAVILSDSFTGDTQELAGFHAAIIESIRKHKTPFACPVILLSGGETTVLVKGDGKGGRNQEFALWLLHVLRDGLWALSCGSDGIDGNSNATGAFLTPDSFKRANAQGLDIQHFLARNDSNSFFKALGDTLETGPTGHNLNDFRAIALL